MFVHRSLIVYYTLAFFCIDISISIETVKAQHRRDLMANELIVFGKDDRMEIVKRENFEAYTGGATLASAEQMQVKFTENTDIESTGTLKKRCTNQKVLKTKPSEMYVGWDVAMSSVIRAPSNSTATVNVAKGYWIGNSLSVSNSNGFEMIKNILSVTLGISFTKSWTTTHSVGYSFTVPAGKYAAIVSNPLTTRYSGYLDIGCLGHPERIEFSAETYQSKSYSAMSWVDGFIGLCVGDTYPLPRCFGNGTL